MWNRAVLVRPASSRADHEVGTKRLDGDADRRRLDPVLWSLAGVEGEGAILRCWEAGLSASDAREWLSVAWYVLADEDHRDIEVATLLEEACRWKLADFAPGEVRAWRDVDLGVSSASAHVHEARRWRAAGFTPGAAARWRDNMLEATQELDFAVLFESAGWHPAEAALLGLFMWRALYQPKDDARRAWLALGLSPWKTLNYVKAGLSREEALAFERLDLPAAVLDGELERRHSMLDALDPFAAMWVNHVVFLGNGGDNGEECAFYERHIRDLHDEDDQRTR